MQWEMIVAKVMKSVKPILQVVWVWPALARALVAQFPSLEKSLAQWLNGLVNSRPELVNISKHSKKKTLSNTSAKRFFFLWLPSGCSEEGNSYLARQCYNIPPSLPKRITLPIWILGSAPQRWDSTCLMLPCHLSECFWDKLCSNSSPPCQQMFL